VPNKSAGVPPRNFDVVSIPGLSKKAQEALNEAFDAMSTWRVEVANHNEKNCNQVIEKMAAAAAAMGWPEQIVDAARTHMRSVTEMQVKTMDQMMDAWEAQLKSPNPMALSPSGMLSKLKSVSASQWPGADAGAENPMQYWMQFAEQWQKNWAEAMTFWTKAARPPGQR
jgi:hypothetical protein